MATPQTSRVKDLIGARWEPLYDTAKIVAGTTLNTQSFKLFATPQGQGGKTLAETNMVQASMLPNPEAFRCYGLEIEAFGDTLVDAEVIQRLAKDAVLDFKVGTKSYLNCPAEAVMGKIVQSASGLNVASVEGIANIHCGKATHFGYRFPKNQFVDIQAGESFSVEVRFNTTDLSVPADFQFRVYLIGLRAEDVR